MPSAVLPDRGVVRIAGEDRAHFLNGLVSADVETLAPGDAVFAALLTPQGKIVVDFLAVATADTILLDCPRDHAAALAKKLGFYKLRAKVAVEDVSATHDVVATWGDHAASAAISFSDPRAAALGTRAIVPLGSAQGNAAAADYHAHRIALGVPEGGLDFAYGDAFPHEANMDRLGGVDFRKGCYVGQEVVSRMEHRGTARTRIVRILFDADPPMSGAAISAGEKSIGTLGSSAGRNALALVRLDRAADALAAGETFTAGGVTLHFPDAADLAMPAKRAHA